ncbi:MAG TPA: hypothetical protein VMC84_01045 [Methanocella sp.]|uniref:hypothetical protein n=1 Tax=Methanocella sp. TaxID=2052833 RepID=UPI002BBCD0BD|nr:hypothetical protein [Methanocella sp.]HTY89741.1 hypothetical protein [Methanocella sp.]
MSWVESIGSLTNSAGPVIQPMYGVPIVKYGPPPSPVPYDPGSTVPSYIVLPSFDWSRISQPPSFTLPDFGHLGFSFPKLIAGIAFVAYAALMITVIGSMAVRGGIWYLQKRNKK